MSLERTCAMTRDQKIVAIGSASGVLTMVAAVTAIFWLWPSNPLLADTPMRLGYTLQANAFAVIPLLLGILVVANARFLGDAIDPTLQKENMAMQINGRVVDNTLQQFVLFLIATTALSVNATSAQMRLIPAATIVFIFRSEPYRLPNRKAKKSHIEVSGRSHAERSVERMNAVPDPEGHAGENKNNCCGGDKPHLSGGRVNTESRRSNKKQNELLQCIINDPAINLHRHVLLL